MATTDDYGQSVSIAELTDAPNAETLAKNIANAIVERSVMRFASAAARSAAIPSPVEGMVTSLADTDLLYRYTGSTWRVVAPWTQTGETAVSFSSKTSHTQSVTFATAFSSTPKVFMNIASGDGSAVRWSARAINITTSGFTLFVYAGGDGTSSTSWSSIPVQWHAVAA